MSEKRRLSDANEAGSQRPSTPESRLTADVAALSLQATPKSQGSGSFTASGGFTSTRVQEVWPWIAGDIEKHDTCSFDTVLEYLLGRVHKGSTPSGCLEKVLQAVLPIANSAKVRQGLEKYRKAVTVEAERYAPFVGTFNDALAQQLKNLSIPGEDFLPANPLDFLFCRNAEKTVTSDYTSPSGELLRTVRKPDLILTTIHAACRCYGIVSGAGRVFEAATRQPPDNFTWHDILSFVEMKIYSKIALSALPSKYGTSLQCQYDTIRDVYSRCATPLLKTPEQVPASGNPAKRVKKDHNVHSDELRLRTLRSRANAAQQTSTGPSPSGSGAEPTLSPSIAESQKVVESERAPPAIQCAIYGAEMLSRAPVVPCAMGMLVQDDVVHVWIYDREGGIQSTGLNFLTDLPRFLVLLFAMQRLQLKDWGFIEKYDLGAIAALGETEPRKPPSPVKVDQFYIDTAVSIHRSLSLKGRGTYVVRARHARPPHGQSPHFVAKFSWADCSRLPERELVQRGIDRAAGNEAVTKHMPYIAHSFELRECTTRTVRAALGIPPKHRLRPDKSEGAEVYRILRVTIVEWMEHLSTLSNERFLRGWFQALIAHYHNWRNGVQHRDISLGNLMRRGKDEDPVCAVLNDWDLGNDAEDPNLTHTGFEVTGTVPFMAIDLLTQGALDGKVAILYRHDLEALIWVLIWVVCCYDDGKMVYTVPHGFHDWDVRRPLSCGAMKRAFLASAELVQPASDNWREGFKLASLLLIFLADKYADLAKAAVVRREAWLRGSGPGFSRQTMPHEQEEEDDPEHVWYEFWAYLKRFKEVVPCIADFMPKDLRKAGDPDDKQ